MIPTPLSPVEKSTSESSWRKVWGQQDHTMVTNFVVPGPGVQEQEGRGAHPALESADPPPHTWGHGASSCDSKFR